MTARRIVVGVSGASGAIYGVRLIEVLAAMPDIEVHAVISPGAAATAGKGQGQRVERTVKQVAIAIPAR